MIAATERERLSFPRGGETSLPGDSHRESQEKSRIQKGKEGIFSISPTSEILRLVTIGPWKGTSREAAA